MSGHGDSIREWRARKIWEEGEWEEEEVFEEEWEEEEAKIRKWEDDEDDDL